MADMRPLALIVYSVSLFGVVVMIFLAAFMQFGPAADAARNGIMAGIGSAGAWAVGSFGGPARWNNTSNILAALLASASLGFLAPADQICASGGAATLAACELRHAIAHP